MAQPKRRPRIPRWGWSGNVETHDGVEEDDRELTDARVRRLFNFLPHSTLSLEDFGTRLDQIRVDYLCGLHHDEFGPSRGDRAAAFGAIISELDALGLLLESLLPRPKGLLRDELSASCPPGNRS